MRPSRIDIVTRGRTIVDRNRRPAARRPMARRVVLDRIVRELRAGALPPTSTDED
jgi:hypothetical protein